jgi:glutaredoxin 3
MIEIYITRTCPYCVRAKGLLAAKKIPASSIKEIDVSDDEQGRATMMERAGGRRTVPQIFINNQHIGGCDDLHALDKEGKLDPLLVGIK